MGNFELKISASADLSKAKMQLNSLLNDKYEVKIHVNDSKIKELKQTLKGLENINIGGKGGARVSNDLSKAANQFNKIKTDMQTFKFDLNMSNATASLNKFGTATTTTLEKAKNTYKSLEKNFKSMQTAIANGDKKGASSLYKQYEKDLKTFNNQIKIAQNEAKKMGVSLTSSVKAFNTFDAVTASNKTLTWLKNNTKAAKDYGATLKELAARQRAATSAEQLSTLNKEYRSIVTSAQQAGKTGNSMWSELGRGFSKIGQFVGVYGILQKGVQTARQMAKAVLDVDTAMTELRKVSDASDTAISKYFSQATQTAKDYGATISDVINSTADWSRLGMKYCSSMQ